MKKGNEVEEVESLTRTEFVEDLIEAGDRELAKDTELVRFLVVGREADATGHTRDYHNWAHSWQCEVLTEACCGERARTRASIRLFARRMMQQGRSLKEELFGGTDLLK